MGEAVFQPCLDKAVRAAYNQHKPGLPGLLVIPPVGKSLLLPHL